MKKTVPSVFMLLICALLLYGCVSSNKNTDTNPILDMESYELKNAGKLYITLLENEDGSRGLMFSVDAESQLAATTCFIWFWGGYREKRELAEFSPIFTIAYNNEEEVIRYGSDLMMQQDSHGDIINKAPSWLDLDSFGRQLDINSDQMIEINQWINASWADFKKKNDL